MSQFSTHFGFAVPGLMFDQFEHKDGDTSGVKRVDQSGTETMLNRAIVDRTAMDELELLDDDGQRVEAQCLLTCQDDLDVVNDEIQIIEGGDLTKWSIVGEMIRGEGGLRTYALRRVGHVTVRRVRTVRAVRRR